MKNLVKDMTEKEMIDKTVDKYIEEYDDPRKGMPSASSFGVLNRCNGQHQMERGRPEQTSADAIGGTNGHAYCYDPSSVELPQRDKEIADEMLQENALILNRIWNDYRENKPSRYDEVRMWYRKMRYSGVPDVFRIRDRRAYIGDYKFGPGHVDHARDNWQLKALAVLADYNHDIDSCYVAIIQPLAGRPTTHYYDRPALDKARNQITALLRKVESENPSIKAGELQCKYCLAKVDCPANAAAQGELMRGGEVESLSPQNFSAALMILPLVEARCKALKEEALRRLTEDPASIMGYGLKKQSERRSIDNSLKAAKELIRLGLIDNDSLIEVCNVPLGRLEASVSRFAGLDKYDARYQIAEALEGNISLTQPKDKVVEL